MATVVYLLIGSFSLASSLDINCRYYGYDWNNWGTPYTCLASMEDVITPAVGITSIVGEHIGSKTNYNVRGVEIHGQKTFYLIRGFLEYFPNMTDLYVFRSDLRNISRSDFKDYQHQLTTLSLSRNHLNFVPSDTFDDLFQLEYLSLSFNALTEVPNLKALTNLKELYLFENSIESLSAADLYKNVKLEVIWLYHNKIRYISTAGIFDYLPSLKLADLTNNRCIDMKYRGQRDIEKLNQVIKNECQAPDLQKLFGFV